MLWLPKLLRRSATFLTLWALLPLGGVFLPHFTTPFSPIASFQTVMLAGLCYLASDALLSRPKLALHLPKFILGAAFLNLGYLLVLNYVALLNAITNNAPLPDFPISTAFSMGGLALLFGLVSSALTRKKYKRAHPPFEG